MKESSPHEDILRGSLNGECPFDRVKVQEERFGFAIENSFFTLRRILQFLALLESIDLLESDSMEGVRA